MYSSVSTKCYPRPLPISVYLHFALFLAKNQWNWDPLCWCEIWILGYPNILDRGLLSIRILHNWSSSICTNNLKYHHSRVHVLWSFIGVFFWCFFWSKHFDHNVHIILIAFYPFPLARTVKWGAPLLDEYWFNLEDILKARHAALAHGEH